MTNLINRLKNTASAIGVSSALLIGSGCGVLQHGISAEELSDIGRKPLDIVFGKENMDNVTGQKYVYEYERRSNNSTQNQASETRQLTPRPYKVDDRSYSFAFVAWNDDGDGLATPNEFLRSETFSISNTPQVNFMTKVDRKYIGFYPMLVMKNESGKFYLLKVGREITSDLAIVSLDSKELMEKGLNGKCDMSFRLLTPQNEIYQLEPIDSYQVNFLP